MVPAANSEVPEVGNITECVLQLQPSMKYVKLDEFSKAVTARAKRLGITNDDVLADMPGSLLEKQRFAKDEARDNEELLQRRHGDPVVYGQKIQLYHAHTQKYIRVGGIATSMIEPSNMRVDLHTDNSKEVWFRIMPRFKIRSLGDPVRANDHVVFESIKIEGQFLHTSNVRSANESELGAQHELNLSVSMSSYTIQMFRNSDLEPISKSSESSEDANDTVISSDAKMEIRNADVIQLFHREYDSYLAAEGTYNQVAGEYGSVSEDVHMRIRKPDADRPHRLMPPTSAVSFWQIERESKTDGGLIRWNERVRLKHMVTQRFLTKDSNVTNAIDEAHVQGEITSGQVNSSEYVCTLTSNPDDPNTLFRLHPVIDDTKQIIDGDKVRIQHALTNAWVHTAGTVSHVRSTSKDNIGPPDSLGCRMGKLLWDNAPLLKVSLVSTFLFEDAFKIESVGAAGKQLDHFNFAAGMIPHLTR